MGVGGQSGEEITGGERKVSTWETTVLDRPPTWTLLSCRLIQAWGQGKATGLSHGAVGFLPIANVEDEWEDPPPPPPWITATAVVEAENLNGMGAKKQGFNRRVEIHFWGVREKLWKTRLVLYLISLSLFFLANRVLIFSGVQYASKYRFPS